MILFEVRIYFSGGAESKKCTSWQGWVKDQGCPLHGGFHTHGSNRSEFTNTFNGIFHIFITENWNSLHNKYANKNYFYRLVSN